MILGERETAWGLSSTSHLLSGEVAVLKQYSMVCDKHVSEYPKTSLFISLLTLKGYLVHGFAYVWRSFSAMAVGPDLGSISITTMEYLFAQAATCEALCARKEALDILFRDGTS